MQATLLPRAGSLFARTRSLPSCARPQLTSIRVSGREGRQEAAPAAATRLETRSRRCLLSCAPGATRSSRAAVSCAASNRDTGVPDDDDDKGVLAVGLGALWVALLGYATMVAPNQTPFRDMVFVKLLIGVGEETEGFLVNPVLVALWYIMGIYPLLYSALLIPAGRNDKLPAWPFVTASFAAGVFALLPYFALWKPQRDAPQLPPRKEELEGWRNVVLRGTEGRVLPVLLLLGAIGLTGQAALAGGAAWYDFGKLFDESRLVHVTTLDFLLLTAFLPFWMSVDAQAREWEGRDKYLPWLGLLPVVGPALYLVLRPKTCDMKR